MEYYIKTDANFAILTEEEEKNKDVMNNPVENKKIEKFMRIR